MLKQRLTDSTALYRALMLVAVLAVFGGQMLEAQHSHAASDNTSECLLCQSSADSALLSTSVRITAQYTEPAPQPMAATPVLANVTLRPPARAPPYNT
ncbi:MAG: hypothetical protein Hals2KO_19020 [Halioglobus sp.]